MSATNPNLQRSASTSSTSRRSANESPSRKPRKPRPKDDNEIGGRDPDPAEFESTFVIEDDSEPSTRIGTMAGDANKQSGGSSPATNGSEKTTTTAPRASAELSSIEVEKKLRKLEKIEGQYKSVFHSYGFSLRLLMPYHSSPRFLSNCTCA